MNSSVKGQLSKAICFKRGLTLIEVLVSMAILLLITVGVLDILGSVRKSGAIGETNDLVLTTLAQARNETLSSRNSSQYGVYFEPTQITYFAGSSYNQNDPSNVVRALPSSVVIDDISLAGGGSTIVFKRLTGETTQFGTLSLQYVPDLETVATISVISTGIIESDR